MVLNFIEYNNFIYVTGQYRLNNSAVYTDCTPVLFKLDLNLNVLKSFKFTNTHYNSISNVILRNKTLLLEYNIGYYVDLPNYICKNYDC